MVKKEKEKEKESKPPTPSVSSMPSVPTIYDHTKPTIQEAVGINPDRFIELGEYMATELEKIRKDPEMNRTRDAYVSRLIEFLESDKNTTVPEKLFAMFKLGRFYEQNNVAAMISKAVADEIMGGLYSHMNMDDINFGRDSEKEKRKDKKDKKDKTESKPGYA